MQAEPGVTHYRSIWISDIHLGTKGCQAELLLDFLRYTDSDHLYLVGDIIDVWHLKRKWAWQQTHNDVLQKILRKARKGTKVSFIPGNHDEMFRAFIGEHFGHIEICRRMIHKMADGRRFLVIHGDQYDVITKHARWISRLGDVGYNLLLRLNVVVNKVRSMMGYDYWSLSKWVKNSVKQAVSYVGDFETTVASVCNERGYAGIICGHIHKAANRNVGGVRYLNCGDWVESCTAILQTHGGQFQVIEYDASENPAVVGIEATALAYDADPELSQRQSA